MKSLQAKKNWVRDYDEAERLTGDLEVLVDFFEADEVSEEEVSQQLEKAEEAIEKLEFRNMLSDEGDDLTAVLQVTAGAGGTESCDWASMLMRMYIMWAEKNGYKVRELNYQEGDVAGIKTVTLEIEGE